MIKAFVEKFGKWWRPRTRYVYAPVTQVASFQQTDGSPIFLANGDFLSIEQHKEGGVPVTVYMRVGDEVLGVKRLT